MYFLIWKSPLIILLFFGFLGYKASSVAGAICTNPCKNGNCTVPDTCSCDVGWTGMQCDRAVDCGDPGNLTNGQRSLSNAAYNSVVTYTCDVGYTLQGSNSRTCQSDGQWNESVPECKKVPSQVTGLSLSKAVFSSLPVLLATWTTPQSDEPISQYIVQYRKHGTTTWGSQHTIHGSPPQNYTNVPRLAAGTVYDVRVRAVSAVGAGMWSAMQTERTYLIPSTISNISLAITVKGMQQVLFVNWTTPQSDVSISQYHVQYTNETLSWTNASTSAVFAILTGLNADTNYSVRVRAESAVGNGSWSKVQTVKTYNSPSRISTITLIKRVNNGPALEVSWAIPQTDLAIFQYTVQYRRRGTTVWDSVTIRGSPPLASTILNKLHAGTEYRVRVQAVSAARAGMWSAVQTERTYKSPSRISTVTLTKIMLERHKPSLTVTWTKPQSELGISNYQVQYRKSEDTRWIPGPTLSHSMTFANLPALTAGTVYSVRVKAVSAVGAGSWSNVQTERTYKFPSQISRISLTKATGNETPALRVNWTSPQSEVAIFQYLVQYRKSEDTHWKIQIILPPATFADITDLDAGTAYSVRVRALSDVGAGNWSEVQTKNTYDPPSRISSISVTKAVENMRPALRVNWTTPQSNFVILRYKVQYKIQSSRAWGDAEILVSPPATSTILTRLEAGTRYSVRVKAMSNFGEGIWSMAEINTTYRLPPHPNHDNVSAVPVDRRGAIRVSWTAPTVPRGELPVTGYSIQYKVGTIASNITTLMVQTSPAEVTGLLPGTEYRVLVASVNPLGTGEYCCNTSTTVHVRTHEATPQPIVSLTNSTLQSLSISWSVTSPQDVTNYIVFWWKESAKISKSVALDGTKFVIEGLLTNTAYHVVVLASGPLGNVNSTSEVYYTTPEQIQGSLSVLVLPKQVLQVSWKPPEDAGRSAIEYIVNTTTAGMDYINSTSVKHPITSVRISGLPQYSSGTVSVWAKNPGVLSQPVVLKFRMVYIITNVSGVSAEWVDDTFTSLRVSLPRGGTYRITYMSVKDRNATETQTVTTNSISHVAKDFRPDWFYTVMVEAVSLDSDAAVNGRIGIGIGIAVAVAVAIIFILLGLCCCWLARQRRYRKRAFLHFTRPLAWRSDRSKVNKPVVMVDVVEPNVDAMQKVDLQEESTPDDESGQADALVNEPNSVSKQMFPAHVREMHRNRDEGFEMEFGNVHDNPNGSDIIAKQNKDRNRYLNTNTFDHSRVILKVPDENGSDYINASYIEGYGRSGHYIASQGPKLEEVAIFWQMVMEQKPAVVVMLTKVEENGKRKCEKYWNDDLHKTYEAGRGFSAVTTGYRTFADYEVRDITVRNSTDRPHKLTHFQYTAWPDHGVPLHPSSLVKFVQEVRKVHGNSQTPMVVHCSAGVGRTGTFITLDAMMERLKERDDLNIFEFVNEMRTRRKQMVQTVNQYAFIHDALSDYITCGDTSMMAHELRGAIGDMDRKEGPGKSGFENQFQFLGSVCKLPVGEDGSFAKKSMVAKKNRYKDKFPYSTNYLHIAGRPPNNAADYINATMMASYSEKRGYVAAQAPLESTRTDVWELIWQLKTKNIVLLGPMKEGKKIMCSPFWPTEAIHSTEYGQLVVTFVDTTPESDWEMTILQVADKNRSSGPSLKVTLFHFLSWQREGRPPIDSMLKMMGQVEKKQKDIKAPLMVMCDDGMSRSGVFITCMTEIERVKVEGGVDIFQTVKAARAQRPFMVYTTDQYKLCFEILQSHLDSFDTYANFKAV